MKLLNILLLSLFFTGDVFGFTVPLTVTEQANLARNSGVVSYGVPFSKISNVTSTSGFKLTTDEAGNNTIDTQFRVTSRYNGAVDSTAPIRVVLLDFQDTIAAGGVNTYYIHTTGGTGTPAGLLATVSGPDVTVNTGSMQFTIDADTGWFSQAGSVLGNTATDGWVVRDINGVDFTSANGTATVTIEENGPIRCVVKTTGQFIDGSSNALTAPGGTVPMAYTNRFVFYKDKSYVKVYPRLENETLGWQPDDDIPTKFILIDYANIKTTTAVSGETVDFGGSTFSGQTTYTLHQDEVSDGLAPIYTFETVINGGAPSTDQYDSYAEVRDGSVGMMIGTRWFWQKNPKQYRFIDNVSYVDLWPDESGTPRVNDINVKSDGSHRIKGGTWNSHELIYYFNDGNASDHDNVLAELQSRLLVLCDDTYMADTKFFYYIPPADVNPEDVVLGETTLPLVVENDTKARQGMLDNSFLTVATQMSMMDYRAERYTPGNPGFWPWYGTSVFGNLPRYGGSYGYSGAHYGWDYSSMVSFLRFRVRDYLDFGEEILAFRADQSTIHQPLVATGTEYHGAHRYEADSSYAMTDGYQASWSSAPKQGTHMWYRGLALQYLLTGEYRFLDAIDDITEGRIHVYFDILGCDTGCSQDYVIRGVGRSIGALLTSYLISGDQDTLTKAYQMYTGGLKFRETVHGNGLFWYQLTSGYETTLFQTNVATSYLIPLYYELVAVGMTTEAEDIERILTQLTVWYDESVYGYYDCADGYDSGDYNETTGMYLPYMMSKLWDRDFTWTCGDFNLIYIPPYIADLFMFTYNRGYGNEYLDKARMIYKDWETYDTANSWETPHVIDKVPGISATESPAWAKGGQRIKKGFYFLQTEYEMNNGGGIDPDPVARSSKVSGKFNSK